MWKEGALQTAPFELHLRALPRGGLGTLYRPSGDDGVLPGGS